MRIAGTVAACDAHAKGLLGAVSEAVYNRRGMAGVATVVVAVVTSAPLSLASTHLCIFPDQTQCLPRLQMDFVFWWQCILAFEDVVLARGVSGGSVVWLWLLWWLEIVALLVLAFVSRSVVRLAAAAS